MQSASLPWLTVAQAREFLQRGTGRGIRIAVLDSGVEWSHPRLAGVMRADDVAILDDGVRLRAVDGEGRDHFGHGTAIAGILHQIAPDAEIGSFRVLGENLRSRTAIIREGVRQALDRGYHILNCSFGCGREDHVLAYKDWIDEAYVMGRHIVAACNNQNFMKREWPGHFPSVITVYFVHSDSRDALYYRPGHLVEFAARGQDIEVPWAGGGMKKVTGSSFATPHVAAFLARVLSCCPALPPLQAKSLLHQIAQPWQLR